MAVNFYSDAIVNGNLTVTSGTSGDATLIISADTDNSEEADSPRLWFKADGDITQGAIQHNDNTFDFISNVSANGGFRFLTGTTNNTGTTDPSNGATERVSIDSAGVTVSGNIELGHASDTTISRSAAGKATIEGAEIMTAGKGTGNITHVVLKDMSSYLLYLFNDDYWYSAGTGTLAILGTSTTPSAISSANSEYQGRVAAYTAPQACVAKKVTFTFYWSSSSVNSADIDFAFSKFTPISDGTAASITMNNITATDHDGSYTEVKPYSKTFTLSGGNASLAAGDAFAMHMRTTGGSSSQRVIVYGTAIIEFELS